MTRQLYDLKHPLYPHPDLLEYHNKNKILYQPQQGSYDDAYKNWYQLVRADHDFSGAPIRPIYREITQIIRLKASGQDYILYGEYLYGQDHENNTVPFFHTYGQYLKPGFRTTYNYETRTAHTIKSGQVDIVYFIPHNPKLMNELYEAGPDDKDIELLVNVGSKQYGGRGFFTYEEFRDSPLEDLARIGREGKGMFTQPLTPLPYGTAQTELKSTIAASTTQQQLWKEFQEFQKFKQNQSQQKVEVKKQQ